MGLRCGVLIIGSLLWDNDGRDRWRTWRLAGDPIRVRVPIRYGRLSSKRGCTYTMIFATLKAEQFGDAVVVPCKSSVSTPENLLLEARWLWAAEADKVPTAAVDSPREDYGSTWGRVAFLKRPGCEATEALLQSWHTVVDGTDSAELLINPDGSLAIPWPHSEEAAELPFDILLATSTRQNTTELSARAIAEAWNLRDHREYFVNNRRSGIRTFQDDEINQHLNMT